MENGFQIRVIGTEPLQSVEKNSVIDERALASIHKENGNDGDAPFPVRGWLSIDGGQEKARIDGIKDEIIQNAREYFYHQNDFQSCFSHSLIHALGVVALMEGKVDTLDLPHPVDLHKSIPSEYKDPVTGMVTAEKGNAVGYMVKLINFLGKKENNLEFTLESGFNSREQILQEVKRGNIAILVLPGIKHAVLAVQATDDGMFVCIDSLSGNNVRNYSAKDISTETAIIISPSKSISRKLIKPTDSGRLKVISSTKL